MEELLRYSPAGVVVIVVIVFLRFLDRQGKQLDKRDELMGTREQERIAQMGRIGEACHEHHQDVITQVSGVIERNNEVIKDNTKTIKDSCQMSGQVVEALRRLNGGSKDAG